MDLNNNKALCINSSNNLLNSLNLFTRHDHKKFFYAEQYGCESNKYDFEIMLAILESAGYEEIENPKHADLIIINTCGVKKPTEDRILRRLWELGKLKKPVVITGCLPRINLPAIKSIIPNYSAVMDPFTIHEIASIAKRAINGEKGIVCFSNKPIVKTEMLKKQINKYIKRVQIAEGCTGICSYCCTRFARGRLFSYPKELIIEEIKNALEKGYIEIRLTAQDTGVYGLDLGYSLVDLISEILSINKEFRIRIGMMNPAYASKIALRLIELLKDPRIYKFIHLPVQSGSNEVLKDMKRNYTVKEFKDLVKSFRENILNISIATDIIVGFPTESDKDFEETLKLLNETKPDIVNVSKFMPRPNTEAALMKQLSPKIIKHRSKILSSLVTQISLENNKKLIGLEFNAYVIQKKRDNVFLGRIENYKPVILKGKELLGKKVKIKITQAFPRYLIGDLC
ncbi:MAG: tRNA (N(6)-L-threonylcarbamoyladenosine(37)-C(2))-methylthiotransferase [Candidatus Bathyarchaeia archaeon]